MTAAGGSLVLVAPESTADAYDRGREMGDTARQLADHAEHLRKINGSQEATVLELRRIREHELRPIHAELARLATQRNTDQATAEALARAVRMADDERARNLESEQKARTSRWQALVPLAALLGLVLSILALARYVADLG